MPPNSRSRQRPMASSLVHEALFTAGTSRNDPCRIHYELHSSSATREALGSTKLFFVAGHSVNCAWWEPQVAHFTSRSSEYTVCIFDNRGVGSSETPRHAHSTTTTSVFAADALDLLDHLGWSSCVHIIGHSMGGMISQELMLMAPERFASCSLLSTNTSFPIPTLGCLKSMIGLTFASTTSGKADHLMDMWFPTSYLEVPGVLQMERRRLMKRAAFTWKQPIRGLIGHTGAVLRHRVGRDRLRSLKDCGIRFLVVTGDADIMVSPRGSHEIAKCLGVEVQVFEECGHAINFQEADRLNLLLE
ncbi:alpha/beta-hydrolase, partial [Ramicandelaber brevisporus]